MRQREIQRIIGRERFREHKGFSSLTRMEQEKIWEKMCGRLTIHPTPLSFSVLLLFSILSERYFTSFPALEPN